jgi:hypothetical protein
MTRILEGFDRFGRWRSAQWRRFIRTLPCSCRDPRCPNCDPAKGSTAVVAAHLCYPLSDHIHRVWHDTGQPSVELQLELVTIALRAGLSAGVLQIAEPGSTVPF